MSSDTLQVPEPKNYVEPIDLNIFKEHTKRTLLSIIDSLPDSEKTLILDKKCISRLNYLIDSQSLKDRGIQSNFLYLREEPYKIETKILLYIISDSEESLIKINNQISDNITTSGVLEEKEYHIIIIPKLNNDCQKYLNRNQNKSFFKIHCFNLDIFTLDYDLISLEKPFIYRDLYIDKDLNILSTMCRAILKYEAIFGKIKYKYYKGNNSKKLLEILNQHEAITSLNEKYSTLCCVIFERNCDFITPFCSQYVYEGMIDEAFGITFNSIKVDPKILEKESKNETIKLDLSKKDKFYYMIKDYNFNKIRIFLPNRWKIHSQAAAEGQKTTDLKEIQKSLTLIKQISKERESLGNQTNIADYLSKLKGSPFAKTYFTYERELLMGEDISNSIYGFYIDEISKKVDIVKILKLICLDSLVNRGIYYKNYDELKKYFLNVYGYQYLFLWKDLEDLMILQKQTRDYSFNYLLNKLNLFDENIDIIEPNDPSYAYGGYCP